ncbi:MAG TPA: ATP-binding protein [Gemmatimonadaceae bacterium]|nr:ATP-binding protein [Gemmatimonadaceae bacterium]
MHRVRPYSSIVSRIIIVMQLGCVVLGTALLLQLHDQVTRGLLVELFAVASVAGVLTLAGWVVLANDHRAALKMAESMREERQLTATLEQAVVSRTSELEDAQRVLQRMWWLGQQITLELNPQRVLERFLEAVADIAQAEGGIVGMISDDGKLHVVVGTGVGAPLAGMTVPITGSAMGRVIRTGVSWTVANANEHRHEIDEHLFGRVAHHVKGVAIIPIARRGERIGAVTIGTRDARVFTTADLERIEAMGDLLSVALENAELVETLRQAEWRFRTLFRAAPDAVFTVLQSGRIREANDAVRDVTGLDPLQVVGRPVVDLVGEPDRERLRAALQSTFDGSPTRVEVTFNHDASPRGVASRRVVALAMSRLPEADPPSVLLVGRDMTAEREMRVRLMESDRLAAVGELVAGVAHEVNNPLSSISAFAQLLLRDGGLSAAQRDSIEVIKSETLRASQVVKDLLAFARRSEPQREPLDLNGVVQRTLRLRGYQLTSNKINVESDLANELPAVVGDARQLQQVCLNLVTNAIQAMATLGAGGTLFISTRREGPHVVLEMRDTGPGIPEDARAHIFEPFFTTKGEGEGTGLGLSVSYGIVTAHGGTIEVPSTSSAGSTFRVSLPAADDITANEQNRDSGGLALRSPLAGIRLLFIDDEPMLRTGVQAFGQMRGFTVVTAADGIQGLDMVRTEAVDAIVCDLRMPGMDGPAFHERLRRERPGLAARTVFITGDVVSTSGRTSASRQPVLTKPFAFEKLEETLVALMRGSPVAASAVWP